MESPHRPLVWLIYDRDDGTYYGWITLCPWCHRIIDARWFEGHLNVMLNLVEQETKGGCKRCGW